MRAVLFAVGAVVGVWLVHLWFDPQRMRSRLRDLRPPTEPDPTACDAQAVAEWIAKHQRRDDDQ